MLRYWDTPGVLRYCLDLWKGPDFKGFCRIIITNEVKVDWLIDDNCQLVASVVEVSTFNVFFHFFRFDLLYMWMVFFANKVFDVGKVYRPLGWLLVCEEGC